MFWTEWRFARIRSILRSSPVIQILKSLSGHWLLDNFIKGSNPKLFTLCRFEQLFSQLIDLNQIQVGFSNHKNKDLVDIIFQIYKDANINKDDGGDITEGKAAGFRPLVFWIAQTENGYHLNYVQYKKSSEPLKCTDLFLQDKCDNWNVLSTSITVPWNYNFYSNLFSCEFLLSVRFCGSKIWNWAP